MVELGNAGTLLDTSVRSATAVLNGLPPLRSYSGLKEVEACPHRYTLSRAQYRELWHGNRHPSVQ